MFWRGAKLRACERLPTTALHTSLAIHAACFGSSETGLQPLDTVST